MENTYATLKCKDCDAILDASSLFCEKCGVKQVGPTEAKEAEVQKATKKEKQWWIAPAVFIGGIMILIPTCMYLHSDSNNNASSSSSNLTSVSDDRPVNPVIKTDYGQIGEYKTMDEYYIDKNGNKVWHGYRKNFYPSGMPKFIEYDQYGEAIWYETYDEAGNILTSTKK